MGSSSSSSSSSGIGFWGLLCIAFIVLKLTGYIDWSWWWVTAPVWGGFVLLILVIFLILWIKS
jgi:uncharacterized membrane protein